MTTTSISLPDNFIKRVINLLAAVALIIMLVHVVIYLAFGVALIPFPFDYDQAEGFELNNAILLSQGRCAWCNNDVFPFFASGYAPLFHIIMTPFVWIFGTGFWYGRLIIFVATLVTAYAIAFAIRREKIAWWIAALAGMSFLASNFIYHIAPLLRQHLLMVMFETLAIVIIAPAFEHTGWERRKRLLLAFMMLLLAGYTKQLAYSTCIAVAAWVFLRNPRTALMYSFGLGAVAAVIFGYAMVITEGQWWVNIISSNQNEYITEQFTSLLRLFLNLHWALVLLALIYTLHEVYFRRLSIYVVWFIVSFISTIGAGKWGAGDSYFATTLVATCIFAGLMLGQSYHRKFTIGRKWQLNLFLSDYMTIGVLSLFIVYGGTVIKLPTAGLGFGQVADWLGVEPKPAHRYPFYDAADWTVGYAVTGHFPTQADIDAGWAIVERIRETEGYVISEDAGFNIQAGREVVTNAVQLRNLWENGLYDPTALLTMIENQEFGLIIRRGDFFPVPVLVAFDTYYELDETYEMNGFAYQLWIPKTPSGDGAEETTSN